MFQFQMNLGLGSTVILMQEKRPEMISRLAFGVVCVGWIGDTGWAQSFIRGDVNSDTVVDIADPIGLLGELFIGTPPEGFDGLPCEDAADGNDDGSLDISDAITILSALFVSGEVLPAPFPYSGPDPSGDRLRCEWGCRDRCDDDQDGVPEGDDCNDHDPGSTTVSQDADCDGAVRGEDCADNDAAVHPGAQEVFGNDIDDDCDITTPDRDRIVLPAGRGNVRLIYPSQISAVGTDFIGRVEITGGAGIVEIGGETLDAIQTTHAAVMTEAGIWLTFNYFLIGPDQFWVFFVYCTTGRVTGFWYTGPGVPLTDEDAEGTCSWDEEHGPITTEVVWPTMELPIPTEFLGGYTFHGERDGNEVEIRDGEPGWMRYGGRDYTLYPFQDVDCLDRCGSSSPGWREVFALIWDSVNDSLGFGILYFHSNNLEGGAFRHTFMLPELRAPWGHRNELWFYGPWTAPE